MRGQWIAKLKSSVGSSIIAICSFVQADFSWELTKLTKHKYTQHVLDAISTLFHCRCWCRCCCAQCSIILSSLVFDYYFVQMHFWERRTATTTESGTNCCVWEYNFACSNETLGNVISSNAPRSLFLIRDSVRTAYSCCKFFFVRL